MKEVVKQVKGLTLGDLVKVDWFDASRGKPLSGGLNGIDVPVTSWGIFIGVLGQKNKHIILAQNNLKRGDELCGAIVYSYPSPITFGRSKVWKGDFHRLQREISTISRVIVHPKYRTIGLGVKLVKETLAKAGTHYVETLAVMAKYNPFFENAGMQKIMESKPSVNVLLAIEQLQELGFNSTMLGSVNENQKLIKQVERDKITGILEELSEKEGVLRKRLLALSSVYPTHEEFLEKLNRASGEDLAVVLKRLAFLAQTKVYLFWRKSNSERE